MENSLTAQERSWYDFMLDGRTLIWIEGYPNVLGSEKDKTLIADGRSVSELCQEYVEVDEKMEEHDLVTAMQIMAAGNRVQEKKIVSVKNIRRYRLVFIRKRRLSANGQPPFSCENLNSPIPRRQEEL